MMKKLAFFLLIISNQCFGQAITGYPIPLAQQGIKKPLHDPPIIINAYTEVLSLDICKNEITVTDPTLYFVGDTVLMIQMKGALIDTSNTAAFGTILDYKNAGNYEMNFIKAISGNKIIFRNKLTRPYDVPAGVVQLVRVPYIKVTNYTGPYTCMQWDGTKGGVLVLNCKIINLGDNIDVSATGFRRGEFTSSATGQCFENGFAYPDAATGAAQKGESIVVIPQNISKGKGSPAGGGGGGLAHNSGGGGGANGGSGGYGGYQSDSCGNAPFDNRGIGGKSLLYNNVSNKIFMGGGGGAGHTINSSTPPFGVGNGGGIAIIIAETFTSNTYKIKADGWDAQLCILPDCNEGMGGGGAGGTVLFYVNQVVDDVSVSCNGGKGANVTGAIIPGGRVGPGGGGGGGMFFMNSNALPGNYSFSGTGGSNGFVTADSGNPWGATSGADGVTLFDLKNPVDTVLFKPNIDSVRISENNNSCEKFNFFGLPFTNSSPIISWQWFFGDAVTANTQNASHTYLASGTYSVKLIATDNNGCKDSTSKNVNVIVVTAYAGPVQSFCSNKPIVTTLSGSGSAPNYSWSPATYLNNSSLQNPIATINTTTEFYVTVTDINGCTATDSVKISVNPIPVVKASKSNDIDCSMPFSHLLATGGLQYSWSPATMLNNSFIANPIANPKFTTRYTVTGSGAGGCMSIDTVTVIVNHSGGLELPNSFTPNGDGLNDCFGIKYPAGVQNLKFVIYNYLGQKIFETGDPNICWNGTYKNSKADRGNYVYYLIADTPCGPAEIKGNVLLLR